MGVGNVKPERAWTFVRETMSAWDKQPSATSSLDHCVHDAILAACAEERREALTEAAELCMKLAQHDYSQSGDGLPRIQMGNRCDDCAANIKSLRDQPEAP